MPARLIIPIDLRLLKVTMPTTTSTILDQISADRPNHVGIAVQRHIRAGRIQERDGKLYATSTATERAHATA